MNALRVVEAAAADLIWDARGALPKRLFTASAIVALLAPQAGCTGSVEEPESGVGGASSSSTSAGGGDGGETPATGSTGSVDPDGGKPPSCGDDELACDGNSAGCMSEKRAACAHDFLNDVACDSDAECAGRDNPSYCHVCETGSGYCWNTCRDDLDCPYWEACLDGRCGARPCASDADCPANFGCAATGAGNSCVRKNCETDADCEDFCVLHQCQSQLGVCACAGC